MFDFVFFGGFCLVDVRTCSDIIIRNWGGVEG